MLSDKSHLCGFAGCRFHGVCAKDSYEGRYHCECPKCNDFDSNDGIVCGELDPPFQKISKVSLGCMTCNCLQVC